MFTSNGASNFNSANTESVGATGFRDDEGWAEITEEDCKTKRHEGVVERRRRFPRQPCASDIRLAWTSHFDKYAMGKCTDVSRTGLQMIISYPIPIQTRICFKADSLLLNGSGTVRHCKRQKEQYIVGVDFAGGLQWRPPSGSVKPGLGRLKNTMA